MLKSLLGKRAGYSPVSGPTYIRYLLPMAVIAVYLLLVSSPSYYLVVSDVHGQTLLLLPLDKGERFALCYEHSVHRTPVIEVFQASSQGELCLVASEFSTYGVGTPFLPAEGELKEINGRFILEGIQRVFPELRLQPHTLTKHQLLYRSQSYALTDYTESGSVVILHVHPGKLTKLWQNLDKGGMSDEP